MSKYNLYTALIGIVSVLFVFTVYNSEFYFEVKILLIAFGVGVFLHSSWILYTSRGDENFLNTEDSKVIRRIFLIDKNENEIKNLDLYGKVSMIIGKDIGENSVGIDLSISSYSATVDIEHAVLNYADGNWYIEDLDSRNGIAVKKIGENKAYRLSGTEPYKLDFGDIIFVGNCQLKVAD